MNKAFLTTMLAATLIAVPAQATVYQVNFNTYASGTEVPLTTTITLDLLQNGVHLHYDKGTSTQALDSAWVDGTDVWGSTTGSLIITFDNPIYGLFLDFSIGDVQSNQLTNAVEADYYVGTDPLTATLSYIDTVDGTFVPYGSPSTAGDSTGRLLTNLVALNAGGAETVVLYFSPNNSSTLPEDPFTYSVNNFNLTNIYFATDSADMPEPATWAMMLAGVVLAGLGRTKRQKAGL